MVFLNLSFTSLSTSGFLNFWDPFHEPLDLLSLETSVSDELTPCSFKNGAFCYLWFQFQRASRSGYVHREPWFLLWRLLQMFCRRLRSCSNFVMEMHIGGDSTSASISGVIKKDWSESFKTSARYSASCDVRFQSCPCDTLHAPSTV